MNKKEMMMTLLIQIIDEVNRPSRPTQADFQKWVNAALVSETQSSEINICLVNKAKSEELNQTFRKKKGPTNILSFEYPVMPGIENQLFGDLIVCSELVEEEAKEQNKSLEAHFAHLTVHGMLHLQHYDHEVEEEAIKMEQLEIEIMEKLGYQNPY